MSIFSFLCYGSKKHEVGVIIRPNLMLPPAAAEKLLLAPVMTNIPGVALRRACRLASSEQHSVTGVGGACEFASYSVAM